MKFRISGFIDRGLHRCAGIKSARAGYATRPWSALKKPVGLSTRRPTQCAIELGPLPRSSPSPHRSASFRQVYDANRNKVRTFGK